MAWRLPWTEEPGGLQFMRPQRVRHDVLRKHTWVSVGYLEQGQFHTPVFLCCSSGRLQKDSSPCMQVFNNATFRLPWWLSGKESTCQCRRGRFDPWSWSIPHGMEELGPCATVTESLLSSLRTAEPMHCNCRSLHALEPVFHKRSRCSKPTHGS